MLESFDRVWSYALLTAPGGQTVTVGQITSVILLLLLGYLGSRLISFLIGRRLAKTSLRPDVIYAVRKVAYFALLVLLTLTALNILGVPLTAFAFATGAIAIGIGFGAQNIINNFISGWILLAERPIRIDDFIELGDFKGTVEQIGTRSTRIRRTDGVHLLVPNSQLLEQTVVNWTLIDHEIRTTIRVGVAYGSPTRTVEKLIYQAITEQGEIKKKPAPLVIFEDFGDNALIFDAFFWCDVAGERELRLVRSQVRFRISELFEAADIVIAFPQRDVHLDVRDSLNVRLIEPTDKGGSV